MQISNNSQNLYATQNANKLGFGKKPSREVTENVLNLAALKLNKLKGEKGEKTHQYFFQKRAGYNEKLKTAIEKSNQAAIARLSKVVVFYTTLIHRLGSRHR